ncbi:MAG: FeoB small GTPase domain-containing protein, partial [Christensenellales bacterium]
MDLITLVGNPNCGKTTLFNKLTKSFEHTGNYSGVTVDFKEKIISKNNSNIKIVDLPGCYSLSPYSIEEGVTSKYLIKHKGKIINICEPKSIRRSLVLTLELIEVGFDVVLLINVMDKFKLSDNEIATIKKQLNINVYQVNIRKIKDLSFLLDEHIYKKSNALMYISKYKKCANGYESIVAIKILEKDYGFLDNIKVNKGEIEKIESNLKSQNLNFDTILDDRMNVINAIISNEKIKKTSILDKIFLNKYLALPLFLGVLLLVFYLTFSSVGSFLSSILNKLICVDLYNFIENILINLNTNAIFNDFILTAVLEGVGSLICFLPQIVLLFIFIAILEESGYLPRLAFLLDDVFSKFGLSGKSLFIFVMIFGVLVLIINKNRIFGFGSIFFALICYHFEAKPICFVNFSKNLFAFVDDKVLYV